MACIWVKDTDRHDLEEYLNSDPLGPARGCVTAFINLTIVARKADGTTVPPRTKKNSPQLIRGMERPILVPSEAYREWERAAIRELCKTNVCRRRPHEDGVTFIAGQTIQSPVNCRALIFRDKNIGDAIGYYQGLADLLEKVGVVSNDRFIVSWDGSQMLKDPANPRYEVLLTAVATQQTELEFGE